MDSNYSTAFSFLTGYSEFQPQAYPVYEHPAPVVDNAHYYMSQPYFEKSEPYHDLSLAYQYNFQVQAPAALGFNSQSYPNFMYGQDPISPTNTESSFASHASLSLASSLSLNEPSELRPNTLPLSSSCSRLPKASKSLTESYRKRSSSTPNIPILTLETQKSLARHNNRTTQPGPIPASKPELSFDPKTGRETVSFTYSKNKEIRKWTFQCPKPDEKLYILQQLDEEFLKSNTVYKRAISADPSVSKGTRHKYEKECNELGWQLSFLNPDLRDSRGLLQRAVDSWRNTRTDVKYRSRRVRKQNKVVPSYL